MTDKEFISKIKLEAGNIQIILTPMNMGTNDKIRMAKACADRIMGIIEKKEEEAQR